MMLLRFIGVLSAGLLFVPSSALADPPGPPALTTPVSVTAEPASRGGASVVFESSAVDWKGRAVPVGCQPASGTLFPLGRTRVSCTAIDRRHERTIKSFPLTVEHLYLPQEGAALRAQHPLRFAWYRSRPARLYNVQLWRQSAQGWKKIASVFPTRPRFVLEPSWSYQGRRYRLGQGFYFWYVWPWLGSRYGVMLGRNAFAVR
jgi:hypothetical protein